MSVQAARLLPAFGSELPPQRSEPRKYLSMSPSLSALCSACVIWPIFSASVIVASRRRMRVSKNDKRRAFAPATINPLKDSAAIIPPPAVTADLRKERRVVFFFIVGGDLA